MLTAHDLLPREPRPGQARAQRRLYDARRRGRRPLRVRARQLVEGLGVDAAKVHVIHHGAFEHLTRPARELPLPDRAAAPSDGPVVLFFGLLRPYKGLETLLEAWRGIDGAELWIVGRPRMALEPLRARAPAGVRFVPRFVVDAELPAFFRRADVGRAALLADRAVRLVRRAGDRARVRQADGASATSAASARSPRPAPRGSSRPATARRSTTRSSGCSATPQARERLAGARCAAAAGPYSWDEAARQTLALYQRIGWIPR